jgi:WD40 repeat protein
LLAVGAAPTAEAAPRLDAFGDPLPERAVARIGTVRLRQGSPVSCVAFSPDGKLLATGGSEDGVRFWDPLTGKEFRRLAAGSKWRPLSFCFSPDGGTLVSCVEESSLRVWDVATGRELRRLGQETDKFVGPAFSPDGKWLAAAGKGTVRVWRASDWKEIDPFPSLDETRFPTFFFVGDGQRLLVGDEGKPAALWMIASRERRAIDGLVLPNTYSTALSPDGRRIVQPDAVVRDLESGKELCRLERGWGWESTARFSPDGKILAVAGRGLGLRCSDAATGKEVARLAGPGDDFTSLAFSSDGKRLAVGCGNSARLWDLATGSEILPSSEIRHKVWAVAFSADGKRLAFTESDSLRMYDVATFKPLWRQASGAAGDITFATDGKTLAVGGLGDIAFHDAVTGNSTRTWRCLPCVAQLMPQEVGVCAPDLKTVISLRAQLALSGNVHVHVWDATTGEERFRFPHEGPGWACAISPDGRFIAVGAEAAPVRVYHLRTGKEVTRLPGTVETFLGRMSFSPDGRLLALRGPKGNLLLVEVPTGKQRLALTPPRGQRFVNFTFSADGGVLVTTDETARLWDTLTGQELGRLDGDRGWVYSAAFAPDGRTLATGDGPTVLLWDVADFVRPAPPVALSAQALADAWADLADSDADKGRRGMVALRGAGPQAVALFRDRLRPANAPTPEQVRRWLKGLDSEDFAAREEATRELEKQLDLVAPALRAALAAGPSAEARRRLTPLIEAADAAWGGGDLRALRAVEILERIGSSEARRALEALAAGAPGAGLTHEAQAALRRLSR